MRVFIAVLVLTLSLQSWTSAKDISEFEIEGISIGDSLLDYFSEEQILSTKQNTQYPNDKFIIYQLQRIKPLNIYEGLNVSIKKNNKMYVVSHIQAILYFEDKIEFIKCNTQRKEIEKELSDLFKGLEKDESKYISTYDNKSPVDGVQIYFGNGDLISINCNDWDKRTGFRKSLDVAIATNEFFNFVTKEAYN